jgi:hypothetical protein
MVIQSPTGALHAVFSRPEIAGLRELFNAGIAPGSSRLRQIRRRPSASRPACRATRRAPRTGGKSTGVCDYFTGNGEPLPAAARIVVTASCAVFGGFQLQSAARAMRSCSAAGARCGQDLIGAISRRVRVIRHGNASDSLSILAHGIAEVASRVVVARVLGARVVPVTSDGRENTVLRKGLGRRCRSWPHARACDAVRSMREMERDIAVAARTSASVGHGSRLRSSLRRFGCSRWRIAQDQQAR